MAGSAAIADQGRGNELIVHGRLAAGEKALERGADVVLVDLEQDTGLFTVAGLKE